VSPPASRLFGTDGIRGLANADLTPELALAVARTAAQVLTSAAADRRPLALVGHDSRASGEMLEAAVVAGLTSAGVDVLRCGVIPTPGLAFLTADAQADLGVMLSASHNPMPDNGIKIFARGGEKLSDDVEEAIEALVRTEARNDYAPQVLISAGCSTMSWVRRATGSICSPPCRPGWTG